MEKIVCQFKYFPILNKWFLTYSSGNTQQRFNSSIALSEHPRFFQDIQVLVLNILSHSMIIFLANWFIPLSLLPILSS